MEEEGWTVRVQSPQDENLSQNPPRTILLIHGLKGDETVMWIFARNLPKNYWMFAPRAPVQVESGGYTWLQYHGEWPALADFKEVAKDLLDAFQNWAGKTGAPADSFDVMGFSQGAAMAYALAAYFPQRVGRVLALAGYLPQDVENLAVYNNLKDKKIYIAHGNKDTVVPVQKAEEAVKTLQAVGADVTYCESDVGHKMSASCLRGLTEFFA